MMRPLFPTLALLSPLALLAAGCPNTTLPDDAFVSCTTDADCPAGASCQSAVGLCANDTAVAQGSPPVLVDVSPIVTPAFAKNGDTVTVTIEVDGEVFEPPAIRLVQDGAERVLSSDEAQSDAQAGRYVSTYLVNPDDQEGAWSVHYRLVNRLGLVSEGVLEQPVTFDLTAPPAVEIAFGAQSAQSTATVTAVGNGAFDDTETPVDGELRSSTGEVLASVPFTLQNGVLSATLDLATVSGLSDGEAVVAVTSVIDLAGNRTESRSAELVIDDTAPTNVAFQFSEDATVSRTAQFEASAADAVSDSSALTIALVGTADAINDARWASPRPLGDLQEVTLGGDDGAKEVTARICDAAGNCGEAADTILLSAVAAAPLLVLPGANEGQLELGLDDDGVTTAGTATPGATLEQTRVLMVDSAGNIPDVVLSEITADVTLDATGTFSGGLSGLSAPELAPVLIEGRSLVIETIVSFEGRQSSPNESRSPGIRIDRTPPQDVAVGFAGGATATSTAETSLVLLQVGADEIFVDGAVLDSPVVRQWIPVAATVPVVLTDGDGPKTVSVQFRDRAHHVVTESNTIELTTNVPTSSPVLTSPWPLSAPGTIARVKPNDVVEFGGVVAENTTIVSAAVVGLNALGTEPANCREVATVSLTDTTLFGSGSVGTPCAEALSVVLEVIVANPAAIESIPQESWSAPLLLDTTPPEGISATLLPSAGAQPGFTNSLLVDLEVGATAVAGEPLEVFISGDVSPSPTTNAWFPLDFESSATQTVSVALTSGEGTKVVQVRFRDALQNESLALNPSITFDSIRPAPLDPALLLFVQTPAAPFDPDRIGEFAFRASGPAIGHGVVFFDADDASPAPVPLITLDINGDLFLGDVPSVPSRRWRAATIDEAGNVSTTVDAFLPLLSPPRLADPVNTELDGIFLGGQIEIDSGTESRGDFESAVTAQVSPAVGSSGRDLSLACESGSFQITIGGAIFVCDNYFFGVGPQSETLRFDMFPNADTDRVLPQTAVVRIFSEAAGLAPGSGSSSAMAIALDASPPLVDTAAIVVTNRVPGLEDSLFGAAGAVTDAEFSSNRLSFSLQGLTPEGTFVQVASDVQVNSDGSFDAIDIGDNAFASLRMFASDPANNSILVDLPSADITPPSVVDLTPTPAAQSAGGSVAITFTVSDENDLLGIPAVTVGGRAATFESGALNTSDGPQAFVYSFTVDGGLDNEGPQPIAFAVSDAFENTRRVLGTLNLDFAAPTSALQSPGAATWNGLPALRGTAIDDNSGVERVLFSIEDQSTSLFFDPQTGDMTSSSVVMVTAHGTTSWTYPDATAFVNGRTYDLAFQAIDAAGNQEALQTHSFIYDDTPVPAPSALVAQSGDEAHVTLTWTPSATATSYFVYYGSIGGTFEGRSVEAGDSPIEIPAPASSIDLVGLPRGSYAFAVTAQEGGQQSPLSNVDEAASRWWEWKSPQFGVDNVSDSLVLAPGLSVFAGTNGSIRRFENGRITLIPSGTTQSLTAIGASGGTLIVGGDGVVLRSIDLGLSFTFATAPGIGLVRDVATNGTGTWVACDSQGDLFRSIDDGVTWSEVTAGNGTLSAIAMSSDNAAAVGTSGRIWTSTNAGATWSEQISGSDAFSDVYGSGSTFVAVGNGGAIHRTEAIGATPFASIALPPTSDQLLSIAAVPAGLAVGSGRDIYLSTDGGASFALVHDSVQGASAFSVSGSVVVAVGSPGGTGSNLDIALSDDGGETWENVASGAVTQLSTVTLDGDRIIAMGFSGGYAQSNNGGLDWEGDGRLTGGQLNRVFVDGNLVMIGGRSLDNQAPGFVARSIDGGESFSVIDPGVTDAIESVHGNGTTIALATSSSTNGGNRAGVLVSTDSGQSFTPASFVDGAGTAVDLEEIWVTDAAIVAGGEDGIFWSVDGGATFNAASINPTPRVRGIWGEGLEFVVVGESGLLATTLDGGATWEQAPAVAGRHYRAVAGDGVDVVAVASNGTDGNSSNGGFVSRRVSPTEWTLIAQPVFRLEAVYGEAGTFVVGGSNTVLRSTDGGQSFGTTVSLPSTIIGALDGDAGLVVGTNISNFPQSVARVSFDDGQAFLTPTRTANGQLGGAAAHVAVDDGVAIIVGFNGAIGVYGPR